ncbi:MAG: transporter substrate-binding domain-containing protein [Holophaga sp.]|nr:transporter substrate-binding domain-containing protein [Holophaga sp.]
MLPITALALGLAFSASAQAQDLLAKVKSSGELVIGSEFQFAPFDFIENGVHKGLNVDVFDQVAKQMGVKAKYVDLPWESVLPGLEAHKYEIVAGPATVTQERMKRYRYTVPIAEASVGFIKRASDKSIKTSSDVAGKAVGGQKASAQLDQVKAFVATLPGKTAVREYIDNNQAYADLAAGRIVAVGNSLPNNGYVAAKRPDVFALVQPTFGVKTYFAFIGLKDAASKGLLDAVDAALVSMEKDGRMATIQKKWFGTTMQLPGKPIEKPNI